MARLAKHLLSRACMHGTNTPARTGNHACRGCGTTSPAMQPTLRSDELIHGEAYMSETTGRYMGVRIYAIVLGILAVLQLLNGNGVEVFVSAFAILFCLGLLIKQKWALIGICLTLLVGILLYFTQTWSQPIIQEEPGLLWPNLIKMSVGILLFIYIGRERIEHRFF